MPVAYWVFRFPQPHGFIECPFNARAVEPEFTKAYLDTTDGLKNGVHFYLLDGQILNAKVVDQSCAVVQSKAPPLRAFVSLRGVGSPSRRQNRYKSILCQEDVYLLELVRYIHLNPLRAGLVSKLSSLDKYSFCGHSVLMDRRRNEWQDTEAVLELFGEKAAAARRQYRAYVEKGIALGKRDDLIGGGLIRSNGGWANVKAMRRAKIYEKVDERILGDGDFVQEVLTGAEEKLKHRYALQAKGLALHS